MSELVTFGETMLRLTPPRGHRLSRVDRLDVHVGGAESNVAVGAANLGVDAAWASLLPATDLGERIAYALRGEGVEPLVTWTEMGRVGTYYFERGGMPRGRDVIYDREGAPIRDATPADAPLDRVRDAEVFFTTGITPALSEKVAETTGTLLETARDAGVRTAFDVNYREKLWSPAAARTTLTNLLPSVDVLFVAERDAREVLALDGDAERMARDLTAEYGFETVVVTLGEEGALALHDGSVTRQETFPADTVDPLGSGDAFASGFLAERMDGAPVEDALAYGAATAALKRTVEGDMARVSPDEVRALVEDGGKTDIER
ncbi:bifunctional 2-dehydro-3-deoxygluconokinase/2-dehydro-3-deoxygalactonokinase [Haloplanus ruber]|uniref:Bifunctional 2-dehydro-3-deoxygluconokinase/2-dehydro-3-deoxygalactonokinase n=1 Tax=Haloplanus ruber TaxID=869892 RepID=A0ABD6D131_9EURY|nr:bifunctional 2-dehydro-3-deoxygluconokinase/2-dehydro-3-deoxygalactonokinase [Haloplanus ruber]